MPSKPIARPRSQPDATVERLVRKWWKDLPAAYDHGSVDKRIKRAWLAEIIIEARQSAARECAEIADEGYSRPKKPGAVTLDEFVTELTGIKSPGDRIRARFGLEGK